MSAESVIIKWFLSQNGKAHKGFTCNEVYKGLKNAGNSFNFWTIYRNIKKLKNEQMLVVCNDCIPMKFKLGEAFKN